MGIYRLNEILSVKLKALQLYIYWGAQKGFNYIAEGNALRKNGNLNLRPERA